MLYEAGVKNIPGRPWDALSAATEAPVIHGGYGGWGEPRTQWACSFNEKNISKKELYGIFRTKWKF